MEILDKRYNSFTKALITLKKSLDKLEHKQYSDYEELAEEICERIPSYYIISRAHYDFDSWCCS